MALGLEASLVDEDAGVGVKAGEGQTDVVVDQADLEGVMRVSCSFMADFFSQPSTTISEPLTATAQVPRLTASRAYST